MTYMLDTNICIYAIKRKPPPVLQHLKNNFHKGLAISSLTLAELEHGVAKSMYPEKNSAALIQFLSLLPVLPFDDMAASEYGAICAKLQKKGTPISTMDTLIAAHAISEQLILVTNNVREFARVPGLEIENWIE